MNYLPVFHEAERHEVVPYVFYRMKRMRITNVSNPRVVRVAKMPRFFELVNSITKFEEKTIKKKIVIVNVPAPTGGDCKYFTTRLNP